MNQPKPILLDRRDAQRIAELLWAVVDEPSSPQWMRDEAWSMAMTLRLGSVYGYFAGCDSLPGEHQIPKPFDIRGVHANVVHDFVTEGFGGEPEGPETISVMLARQADGQPTIVSAQSISGESGRILLPGCLAGYGPGTPTTQATRMKSPTTTKTLLGARIMAITNDDDEQEDGPDMKVRLLTGIGGQIWTEEGPVRDAKRGDIIRLEKIQALRMIANGQATAKLDGEMTNRIGDDTPEAVKAGQHPDLVAYNKSMLQPKAVAVGGIYDPSPVNFPKAGRPV